LLLVRLEDRFRGGRGTPISVDALLVISKRYHDMPYHDTLAEYRAAYEAVVGPYRDALCEKVSKKCGRKAGPTRTIMTAVETADARPVVAGKEVTLVKPDGSPLTFKTSSAGMFPAYWDILRAVDPLLQAVLDVGKDAATAEESITELNKVAAYDTAGHVAATEERLRAALKAAGPIFGV
jgi:hypothetical protein